MERSALEVVRHCQGCSVSNQREDTLVLGGHRGVVERGATQRVSGANLAALTDHQVHALNVPADSDKGTAGVMLYIHVYNVHVHQAILWALNSNLRAIYRNHT